MRFVFGVNVMNLSDSEVNITCCVWLYCFFFGGGGHRQTQECPDSRGFEGFLV